MAKIFQDMQDDCALALGYPGQANAPTEVQNRIKRAINEAQRDLAGRAPMSFLLALTSINWNTGGSRAVQNLTDMDPTRGALFFAWNPAVGGVGSQKEIPFLPRERFYAWRASQGAATTATSPNFYTWYADTNVTNASGSTVALEIFPPPQVAGAGDVAIVRYFRTLPELSATGDTSALSISVEDLFTKGSIAMTLESLGEPELIPRAQYHRQVYEAGIESMLRNVELQAGGMGVLHGEHVVARRYPWAAKREIERKP